MPSARQIANVLRKRGVDEHTLLAIKMLIEAIEASGHGTASPQLVAEYLRSCKSEHELHRAAKAINKVLDAMTEIENTYVPSKALTAGDVRRQSARKELASEQ